MLFIDLISPSLLVEQFNASEQSHARYASFLCPSNSSNIPIFRNYQKDTFLKMFIHFTSDTTSDGWIKRRYKIDLSNPTLQWNILYRPRVKSNLLSFVLKRLHSLEKNETIENSNFLFNLNIFNLSFDYIEQFNKQFYYFIWQPLLYNSRRNSKYIFNLIIMVPFGKLNAPNCFSYYCHLLE